MDRTATLLQNALSLLQEQVGTTYDDQEAYVDMLEEELGTTRKELLELAEFEI